jgi:UDP-4-amino-4,6-dideoxy-N-acetyl-beta-L-altrosamine N-acetyltransferase
MRIKNIGTLRAIKDDELESMRSWRNAPAVRANMYTRHEISVQEHREWWARIQGRTDHLYFMYEVNGFSCGIVAFTSIDAASRNSAWAFYASPDAPRGTGTKMEWLALNYAFDELKLHKLYCEVLSFNTLVIKLHLKFGFKHEGVFREQHLMNECFVDVIRLGILETEWRLHRSTMEEKLLSVARG